MKHLLYLCCNITYRIVARSGNTALHLAIKGQAGGQQRLDTIWVLLGKFYQRRDTLWEFLGNL
jgi:hypothetical protein